MTSKCLVLPCLCLTGVLGWALREVAVGMFYTMQSCHTTSKVWRSTERSHVALGQHQGADRSWRWVSGVRRSCQGVLYTGQWLWQLVNNAEINWTCNKTVKPWSLNKSLSCFLHVCVKSGSERFVQSLCSLVLHLQTWYQEKRRENWVWEAKAVVRNFSSIGGQVVYEPSNWSFILVWFDCCQASL